MSLNLIAAIEQEEHGYVVRPMMLPRLQAGITSSAKVCIGDTISFGGIEMSVANVVHRYELGTDAAPVTTIHGVPHRPLFDNEIELLIDKYNFKDV